jgi:hypothetical protein
MKKRQKKGEAAPEEGVKQSNPAFVISAAPVEKSIPYSARLYNRTSVRIGASEVEA